MGIAPYKTFTFDGVSSANYDVYLTGVGVYNAPKRSVEMFSIAGRNGDYALDQGKFENITVTYKVGMYDTNENNFATKVSNFRNWLCSKVGYVRLEDEYNPNEYRMAVYADGFELDHDMLIAGEAEIEFNCKPQRWLTSGETATAVANNGTLSNPTLFNSEPLLEVKGYGTIDFNGYEIEIEQATPVGEIVFAQNEYYSSPISLDLSNVETGDNITINIGRISFNAFMKDTVLSRSYVNNSFSATDSNSAFSTVYGGAGVPSSDSNSYIVIFRTLVDSIIAQKGTSKTVSNTVTGSYQFKYNGTTYTVSVSVTQAIAYDGANTVTMSLSGTVTTTMPITTTIENPVFYINKLSAYSTASLTNDIINIDCEIGECWTERNGEIVTLNNLIAFGSDLPVLSSGTNTFNYDNTITQFKVTPRWWKV